MRLPESERVARFERAIMPHLRAAYNLARWLVGNEHDAEDLVQEAYLRAFTYFDGFRGEDGRGWLLAIVRNTCYSWLQKNRAQDSFTPFEEEEHSSAGPTPETEQLRRCDGEILRRALDELPAELRECLILRELEDLSYRQIAQVTAVPLGTVMSRLARARQRLRRGLSLAAAQESST